MPTPTSVKTFRSNSLDKIRKQIEAFYQNETPDVLEVTHSGTNDILVMIHYK
jgi:hypothetical protein